jgi:hypothetical protein
MTKYPIYFTRPTLGRCSTLSQAGPEPVPHPDPLGKCVANRFAADHPADHLAVVDYPVHLKDPAHGLCDDPSHRRGPVA